MQQNVSLWPTGRTDKPEPLGRLTLRFLGDDITLTGGPYLARPRGTVGVKMAKEIRAPADINIATEDFKTPPRNQMYWGMVMALGEHFTRGKPLYVGCMAGKGRTGLFLATLAHLSGEEDPVGYVRRHYYAHAVETREQERFVTSFDRSQFLFDLTSWLNAAGEINFTRLRKMTWRERRVWLKVRFGL